MRSPASPLEDGVMRTPLVDAAVVPPSAVQPARLDFIDAAKAVGIVMVVAGHVPEAPPAVITLIYSFHMPLFFLLSGALLSDQRAQAPMREVFQRGVRTLLVPYLFFFAVSLAYWLLTRNIGARALKFAGLGPMDALVGLFTGRSQDLFVNLTLWFLPCLFLCQLLYAMARRIGTQAQLLLGSLVVAALLLIAEPPGWVDLPWSLGLVWVALPFYALGHWQRTQQWRGLGPAWMAPLLWGAIWLLLVQLQGRSDFARGVFGAYPVLYLPCAITGIAMLIGLLRRLPASTPLRVLSDASLVIFPLHTLLINFLSGAVQRVAGREAMAQHPLLWWGAATAFGLLGGLAAARLLRRHAPQLVGLR